MIKKPKGFVTCYICQREFGSRSILFHEPQCLLKWRNENNKLPSRQRPPTPTKPNNDGTCSPRPTTATLECPTVLDPTMMHHDMTANQSRTLLERPRTFSVAHPTPNLKVPHVDSTTSSLQTSRLKLLERNGHSGTKEMPRPSKTVHKDESKRPADWNGTEKETRHSFSILPISPPKPCQTCANGTANIERFHSHPQKAPNQQWKSGNSINNDVSNGDNKPSNANEVHGQGQNRSDAKKNGKGSPMKPCPVCGQLFGTLSLPLHEPKCLERWQRENGKLLKDQRLIEKISEGERNNSDSQKYLLPCNMCGRTFLPDRLLVHHRICQSLSSHQTTTSKDGQERIKQNCSPGRSKEQLVTPRFAICYICGREFGSKSIAIHEPQCLKKWQAENARLPKHMQRQEPVRPILFMNGDELQDLNALATAAWNSHLSQLIPCPHCKRTFNPDRLEVHERVCQTTSRRGLISAKV